MKQNSSAESDSHWSGQESLRLSWYLKVHYGIHKSPPLAPVRNWLNQACNITELVCIKSVIIQPFFLSSHLSSGLLSSGFITEIFYTLVNGRAIAQAVSHWLPTAAARVRSRVWSSGICGGQIGAGAGSLRVLRFPLPIFIPSNFPSP
jgi:hypothetical protein